MATVVKWSINDYHLMIESGLLNNRLVELIEGEIIEMSPESPLHRFANDSIAEYLRHLLQGKAKVFESHPITLSDSEPEPDIAIVRLPNSNYLTHHPYPEDIYWLIEISNTTLEEDLTKKKQIYAKAEISEYWIVDLKHKELIVYREPFSNNYKTKFTLNKGTINPMAFPDISIAIKTILT